MSLSLPCWSMAWTAIDRLSVIWKSDLTDKMKKSFFQAAVVSTSCHTEAKEPSLSDYLPIVVGKIIPKSISVSQSANSCIQKSIFLNENIYIYIYH